MSVKNSEEYVKKLENERARLVKEIKQNEKPADFGGDIDHFDEEADEAEELGEQVGINATLRSRVSEIDSILNKLGAKSPSRRTRTNLAISRRAKRGRAGGRRKK